MAVTDGDRNNVHNWLNDMAGEEIADTLMALLPPVGWADVARQRDVDVLGREMDLRFDAVDQRFDALGGRMGRLEVRMDAFEAALRRAVFTQVATTLAAASAVIAVVRL